MPGKSASFATISVIILACLSLLSERAVSQSQGFISTRPDCVPGAQQTINYVQGPDPILDEEGYIHIFVNAGECCQNRVPGGDGWESIFNLSYPSTTPLATPRFFPIWASNNFGTEPERYEQESGFPSYFEFQGLPFVLYTVTHFPRDHPNRDRGSRIDMTDLRTRAASSAVHNKWIEPVDPSCRDIGTCSGKGSGVLGTAVIAPDGELFIYHPDGNYPECPSGWIRHKINGDLSVANPSSEDGCLEFEGLVAPPFLSDIGLGQDGLYYMISDDGEIGMNGILTIREWISVDGLYWEPSGRKWFSPDNPNPDYVYSIWDGAYLKTPDRRIVEPRMVISQISEGDSHETITDASSGRWKLYYWAEEGLTLPPNFAGEAHSCDTFGGSFDSLDCTAIRGWAWDSTYPNYPISVDVYDGSSFVGNIPANLLRGDLVNAGIGNGEHAFSHRLLSYFRDGGLHTVTLKAVHSDHVIGLKDVQCGFPDHLLIENETLFDSKAREACLTVTAESVTIDSDSEMIFRAEELIALGDGFQVDGGASFVADTSSPAPCS